MPCLKWGIKKRHIPPKNLFPGRYTVGGDDETYYYWERNGILWDEPEMKEWLTQVVRKGKKVNRG